MASQERHNLTSFKSEGVEALARKTEALTESWQRERRARLLGQLAVNAEIKQRWLEPHHPEALQARVTTGSATVSRYFQPRGSPFKALLAAGKKPVNNALAYIASVLGLQRLASHQTNRSHG